MTSYAALLQNTLVFLLALSALAITTHKFSLKRRKKTQIFVCAFGVRKTIDFFLWSAEKMSTFLGVDGFAPFGKISAGAHDIGSTT